MLFDCSLLDELPPIENPSFATHFDRFSDAKLLLLGDASHGTGDFYTARAAITKRFISEYGHKILAIEADPCDVMVLDRFVRLAPGEVDWDKAFPHANNWVWKNEEFRALISWISEWNRHLPLKERVAIFGLDCLKTASSMNELVGYLEGSNSPLVEQARRLRSGMLNFKDDPAAYAALAADPFRIEAAQLISELLSSFRHIEPKAVGPERELWFNALLCGVSVVNSERFERSEAKDFVTKWNVRDTHMFLVVHEILEKFGSDAKMIIWAHNNHVGHAAFSEIGYRRHQTSLGELLKNQFGDEACLIGFGTGQGSIFASRGRGHAPEAMSIGRPIPESWENLCHNVSFPRFLMDTTQRRSRPSEPRPGRTFGTFYRPDRECDECYLEADLFRQFDAWVWIDATSALNSV
ncbi:erythromycin esterase family protein [Gluconobacter cerinus]